MSHREFDVIVIGGGPGGYYATLRLAQRGLRVACVERDEVGGVCLNWGCIPSKALIHAAHTYERAKSSAHLGVRAADVSFDLGAAQDFTRGIVKHHTGGVAALMRQNGAELVRGQARIAGADRVEVAGFGALVAQRGIVVATGARPRSLPGFTADGERILSAREAIRLSRLPRRLLVLGGGVIGIELGSLFQRLGSELTLLEALPEILPSVDRDLARVVERRLRKKGARVLVGARANGYRSGPDSLFVDVSTGDTRQTLEVDQVLVAIGFTPNTESLFDASLNVALDRAGHLITDAQCRTNLANVFAIGDVSGPPYLAHKAFKEAEVVADVILGKRTVRDFRAMPMAIFSDPEIAVSGVGEDEARKAGTPVEIGRFPFSALGKAQAIDDAEGFVKVVASRGRLVGFGAVGPHVSELLGEATLALETQAGVEDLALTVHPHPTISEALREAAEHALGQAIHIVNARRKVPPAKGPPAQRSLP